MVDSGDTATSFLTLRSHFSKTIRACWSIATLEVRCTPCLARLFDAGSVGNIPSASSQALPAPNPVPNHTGHVLRLNNNTENMTPKEKPSVARTAKEEIARSH